MYEIPKCTTHGLKCFNFVNFVISNCRPHKVPHMYIHKADYAPLILLHPPKPVQYTLLPPSTAHKRQTSANSSSVKAPDI